MTNKDGTILWHDYETWGVNPMVDFPVQFAAIRTNLDLDIIETEQAINLMCKIPHDYLPQPQACLVTGITPSYSLLKGLTEPEFAKRIFTQMHRTNTCVAGYNSMRFDEEVTRHMLFRNLFPVYDREFKHNNSRWDVIDLIRACYALRPTGIKWPRYDDGRPCFKLEELSRENDLEHLDAHDALSDVKATISLAKLVKTAQPKLYDYYWQLRNKYKVKDMLEQYLENVFVHVSPYINSLHGCCTLVTPVCAHPSNTNAIICIDLSKAIELLIDNDESNIKEALFSKALPQEQRPGLLLVNVNKCPFVAPLATLDDARAVELCIDKTQYLQRYQLIKNHNDIVRLCQQVFTSTNELSSTIDIDKCLYTSEFPTPADISKMEAVRNALPQHLEAYRDTFESATLNKVLARYIARNYPGILDEKELWDWQQHLRHKLSEGGKKESLSLNEYFSQIEELLQQFANNPNKIQLLTALKTYGEQLISG